MHKKLPQRYGNCVTKGEEDTKSKGLVNVYLNLFTHNFSITVTNKNDRI